MSWVLMFPLMEGWWLISLNYCLIRLILDIRNEYFVENFIMFKCMCMNIRMDGYEYILDRKILKAVSLLLG